MEQLSIKDISYGKTDAFNELLELGQDYFTESFVNNPKYRMNDFIDGNKCFVCGKKGTGKTAFLRYLECKLQKPDVLVIPIRFKSEFDDIDKERFINESSEANMSKEDKEKGLYSTQGIAQLKSYVLMWKAFLINRIIQQDRSKEWHVFTVDTQYNTLVTLLHVLFGETEDNHIVMPKIKKGSIDISANLSSMLSARLKLDLDFDTKNKRINYQKTAKTIESLFRQLQYDNTKVFFLIDELELSVRNKDMHNKDIILVRDLILAVDDLNKLCKVEGFDIHFIASIRSEVINSVISAGFEINKCIEDYGITIDWFQKGGDYKNNPLLAIIENKIHASERRHNCRYTDNVWESYFENKINGIEVRKYILNNTWYRPRDVIRLMLLLQNQIENATKYNQEMFDRAQQEYSNRMWNELSEELRLSYTVDDLNAIKTFFNRIELPFNYDYLNRRIEDLGKIFPNIKAFFEKEALSEFIRKMFELGIIGNSGQRMVFCFLGYDEISMLDPMVIHNPLRNFFAVQSKKESDS